MATRTFLAVPLDEPIVKRLRAAQDQLRGVGGDVKWVEPANLHLTLKFLGDVEDRELGDVCDLAADVAASIETFDFSIPGLSAAPPTGQLRMIWAKVDDPSLRLVELAQGLEEAYGAMGFKQEHRKYHPHLTLGRVRTGRNVRELRSAVAALAETHFGVQGVGEVVVCSSTLSREGPAYVTLATCPLR